MDQEVEAECFFFVFNGLDQVVHLPTQCGSSPLANIMAVNRKSDNRIRAWPLAERKDANLLPGFPRRKHEGNRGIQ